MGQTVTFAKGGYVHADSAEQEIDWAVRDVIASALDKFPGAEVVGDPLIELSDEVETLPLADGEEGQYRVFQIQLSVRQP
jgi:hypothetical protein